MRTVFYSKYKLLHTSHTVHAYGWKVPTMIYQQTYIGPGIILNVIKQSRCQVHKYVLAFHMSLFSHSLLTHYHLCPFSPEGSNIDFHYSSAVLQRGVRINQHTS